MKKSVSRSHFNSMQTELKCKRSNSASNFNMSNRNFLKSKASQITIFIIIGIILVVSIATVFYFSSISRTGAGETNTLSSQEIINTVKEQRDLCFKEKAIEGLDAYGLNETSVQEYIKDKFPECILPVINKYKNIVDISVSGLDVSVKIDAEKIDIQANYPVTVKKGETQSIDKFSLIFPRKLSLILPHDASTCKVNSDTFLKSFDERFEILVKAGTTAKDVNGGCLNNIEINLYDPIIDYEKRSISFTKLIYVPGPLGAEFDKPVNLELNYTKKDYLDYNFSATSNEEFVLPENQMRIQYYDKQKNNYFVYPSDETDSNYVNVLDKIIYASVDVFYDGRLKHDASCKITKKTIIESADRRASVAFQVMGEGIVAKTSVGNCLDDASIEIKPKVSRIINIGKFDYDFLPDGTILSPFAKISYRLSENELANLTSIQGLRIAWDENGVYRPWSTSVDEAREILTAEVTHFSVNIAATGCDKYSFYVVLMSKIYPDDNGNCSIGEEADEGEISYTVAEHESCFNEKDFEMYAKTSARDERGLIKIDDNEIADSAGISDGKGFEIQTTGLEKNISTTGSHTISEDKLIESNGRLIEDANYLGYPKPCAYTKVYFALRGTGIEIDAEDVNQTTEEDYCGDPEAGNSAPSSSRACCALNPAAQCCGTFYTTSTSQQTSEDGEEEYDPRVWEDEKVKNACICEGGVVEQWYLPSKAESSTPSETLTLNLSVGNEEDTGGSGLIMPRIYSDALNQPHITTLSETRTSVFVYHKINNVWQGSLFADKTECGSGIVDLNTPNFEIDNFDYGWLSVGAFGGSSGVAVFTIKNISQNPQKTQLPPIEFAGRRGYKFGGWGEDMSTDFFKGTAYIGQGNDMIEINNLGEKLRQIGMDMGSGGEKTELKVSGNEETGTVIHGAYAGCCGYCCGNDDKPSSYKNSVMDEKGLNQKTWAKCWGYYDEQGDDNRWMGIGNDLVNPEVAYMITTFNDGVVMNIWNGQHMVFNTGGLPVLDSSPALHGNGLRRYTPSLAPAINGGTYICWTGGDDMIKLKYVTSSGAFSNTVVLSSGSNCGIATDNQGNLHVAYVNNGLKYRKVLTNEQTINQNVQCGITYPVDGMTFNYTAVTIGVEANRLSGRLFYKLNNGAIMGFNYGEPISLVEGQNNLTIYGTTKLYGACSDSVNFLVNSTVPIEVISPKNGEKYNQTSLILNVSSYGRNIALWQYSLNNGQNITFTSGEMINVSEGENYILVYAKESETNRGVGVSRFDMNFPPVITVNVPVDNTNYDFTDLFFNVSSNQAVVWTYSINNSSPRSFRNGEALIGAKAGLNNLKISASNANGSASKNIVFNFTVLVPSLFPKISIIDPKEGFTYTSGEIYVSATSDQEMLYWKYSINGGQNISFSPPVGILMPEGNINLTVSGKSRNGPGFNSVKFFINSTSS